MKNDRQAKLDKLLQLEIADKSFTSSLAFFAFAIFTFFYTFNTVRFALLIKIVSVILIVTNLVRFKFCNSISQSRVISERKWKCLRAMIWINALGWSLILNFASFELKLQGIDFIVVTTILAGFVGSSIVTLAYFPGLFLPFQVLLLIPQIFIILYYYYFEDINLLPLIFLYVMYFLYQIKQYQVYRKENLKRFIYQLDLEEANMLLKKNRDELIEQTVKMIHVSRLAALGEMAAGIAHEINNPLTVMNGGAKLVEKYLEREPVDLDSIRKQSIKIQNSANRVTRIIQGLKNFSNLSDKRPKEDVTLQSIVEETMNFCSELLISQGIKLKLDPVPDCYFHCHPVQISQVLVNLIKNAEDEIVEKDYPEEERWIQISFSKNNHTAQVAVSNGGERLDPELNEKIFNPFYSTKPVGKGTGLGLSISQKIMREHSGDLILDPSSVHTTFVLSIPIPQEKD